MNMADVELGLCFREGRGMSSDTFFSVWREWMDAVIKGRSKAFTAMIMI